MMAKFMVFLLLSGYCSLQRGRWTVAKILTFGTAVCMTPIGSHTIAYATLVRLVSCSWAIMAMIQC